MRTGILSISTGCIYELRSAVITGYADGRYIFGLGEMPHQGKNLSAVTTGPTKSTVGPSRRSGHRPTSRDRAWRFGQ